MKFGIAFCLPFLCLLQNVQLSQGANLFLNEDGSDSAIGLVVCTLIPCVDPDLGARNFFAPVRSGPNLPGEESEQAEGETGILQELIRVTTQVVSAVVQEQAGNNAGGDGTTIVFDDEASAQAKLRGVAIQILNAFLNGDGTDATTTTTTTTTKSAAAGDGTPAAVGDVDDEKTARDRLRTVALSLIDAFFDVDGGTEETGTGFAGIPEDSTVRETIRTQVIDAAVDVLKNVLDRTRENGGTRRRLRSTSSAKEMLIKEYRAAMKKTLSYMGGDKV